MKQTTLLLVSLLFFACKQSSSKVSTLEIQTEAIHDEAMKDLTVMQRTIREIKSQLNDPALPPERMKVYADLLKKMNKADEDMSEWMVNYKSPEGMKPKDAEAYLLEQKRLIEMNRRDIKEATQAGKMQLTKP